MYSWIHRLVRANGLNISEFSNAYLETSRAPIGAMAYDIKNEFVPLFKHLLRKPDIIEFFLATNTFRFEAMMMPEGQQTKYINNVFSQRDKLNTVSNGLFQSVNICPECRKEEIGKYGECYLHRHHQLSGVQTCHKHHCMLLTFKGKKGHACDYDLADYNEISTDRSLASDNVYTEYVSSLFEADLSTNIKVLKDILYSKLKEEGYVAQDKYKSLIEKIRNWEYNDFFCFDVEQFLKVKMISANNIFSTEIIPFFMLLYPNVQELIRIINNRSSKPLIGQYVCSDCGGEYISTPYGFENQIGCPYCNGKLSEQDILNRIFSNFGYELKSEFVSSNKNVSVLHKKCGKTIVIKPRAFLYEGVRCLCETTISFDDAEKTIKELGDFELLKFINTENPCKIRSNGCGHTFNVRYPKFLQSPQCRICFPSSMTTEYLAERIMKTTNGEYELVGEFVDQAKKIRILHHRCGEITEYSPRYYHMGAVCPVCDNKFSEKWENMYQLLCEYKEEYGNVNIPKRDIYKGRKLGDWCQTQRRDKGMDPRRKQKLYDIGFVFDPLEEEWNRRFEQYKRYTVHNGCRISRRTDFEGEHLGAWVETQRKQYRAGKLSKERYEKLTDLGMQFE